MLENVTNEATLIEKAQALIPVLKDRAQKAARDRCMPKATHYDFR